MNKRRRRFLEYQEFPLGYYHLCTDGWKEGRLFYTREQFAFGMATIGLVALMFNVRIYALELMPNHIHLVVAATGAECVKVFYYIIRRINKRLKKDGYPILPHTYSFKLVPIEDKEAMQKELVYLARNAYEKGACTPCGHMWGTGYLLYNQLAQFVRGKKVKEMSSREVSRLIESEVALPEEWEIHPELGVLPRNFLDIKKLQEVFPSPKDFVTFLVKDYESYNRLSKLYGEELEWSLSEARDVTDNMRQRVYPGRVNLTQEEKCLLASRIHQEYQIPLKLLSQTLFVPERILLQSVHSKDLGYKRTPHPAK